MIPGFAPVPVGERRMSSRSERPNDVDWIGDGRVVGLNAAHQMDDIAISLDSL